MLWLLEKKSLDKSTKGTSLNIFRSSKLSGGYGRPFLNWTSLMTPSLSRNTARFNEQFPIWFLKPWVLGEITSLIGSHNVNITSVEMVEKTKSTINFHFNLLINDLKNFTNLISQLKQKEYSFKIIRHKNKKYAFFKKILGGFKKN